MTNFQSAYPQGSSARRVIEYAAQLFFAKGLKLVTMDDIAKGLQMSKRTLYQLFADKEQLIIACFIVYAEEEKKLSCSLIEKQYNVLEIVLNILEQRLKLTKQISKQFLQDFVRYESVVTYVKNIQKEHIDRAVTFLSQGVEQGFFRKNVNFALIIYSMMVKGDSFVSEDNFNNISIQEYFINIELFHLRGCCTEKGIKIIDEFLEKYLAEK